MTIVKTTLSLSELDRQWMDSVIARGEYVSNSEYIRSLIKEDKKRQAEIDFIRAKLEKAEQSGFTDQTLDEVRAEFKERLRRDGKL